MKTASIKKRLGVGLQLLLLFFIAQVALTWWLQEQIKTEVVETVRKNTQAVAQLNELALLAQQIRRYEKEYFLYLDNPERRAKYEKQWSDSARSITSTLETMRINQGSIFQGAEVTQVAVWRAAGVFYVSEMRHIFSSVNGQAMRAAQVEKASAQYSAGPANEMIEEGKDRFSHELIKGVTRLQAEKTKAMLALTDVAQRGFLKLLLGTVATALIGILVAVVLAFYFSRLVLRPVRVLTATAEKISLGQTHAPVSDVGLLEFRRLAKALERMRKAQEMLVRRVRARASDYGDPTA